MEDDPMNREMDSTQEQPPAASAGRMWLTALAPLVLLGLVIAGIFALRPTERLMGEGFPPVEDLTVVRTVLPREGLIELHVVNGGPDPVTIAQVLVDEAYWEHAIRSGRGATDDPALAALPPQQRAEELQRRRTLPPLGRAVIALPYMWVGGEAHEVVLVSATGATFPSEIEIAVRSPSPTAGYFGLFALLGVLVGVIPVYLGLAWYPLIRRLSDRAVGAILCFTLGLLLFLMIDSIAEAFEGTEMLPGVYGGAVLVVMGIGAAVLTLTAVSHWLRRRAEQRGPAFAKLGLAYLIATGIGLHNLGEGLAIGAAFNLGEASLGAMLIVGFTLHNITEGLAIVAPLSRVRAALGHLLLLGLVAGAPTVLGGWIGGFAYSPLWAVLFLGLGAGAILQVICDIAAQMAAGAREVGYRLFARPANLGGLAAGYLVMYLTGLLV